MFGKHDSLYTTFCNDGNFIIYFEVFFWATLQMSVQYLQLNNELKVLIEYCYAEGSFKLKFITTRNFIYIVTVFYISSIVIILRNWSQPNHIKII